MSPKDDTFSLLIVDDEPKVISALGRTLRAEGYDVHGARNGQEALALLRNVPVDAAIVDLKMPGMDGLSLLHEIKTSFPEVMVVILTGHGGIEEAVQAIKLGAEDFLEKPFSFSSEGLRARIGKLHRIWALTRENERLRNEVASVFEFEGLVGNAPAMLKLKQTIAQVGPSDVNVLLQGETGTGKELVARAIHRHSPRSEQKFIAVDCAGISESLVESELFGHAKGAFTGAHVSTPGLIRSADNGTLFLDELAELSLPFQAKLLRVVQEREVRPVGNSATFAVDVRIVSATNRDLAQETAEGRFREDLFFRLDVVTIDVPPLRDRKEDVPLLVRYVIERFKTDLSPVEDVSPEAFGYLERYDWPGNVREMENVIRRAIALGKGSSILPQDLPPSIYERLDISSDASHVPQDNSLEAYEKAAISNALAKSNGNRKQAASILGIAESTLYRKMKLYDIKS